MLVALLIAVALVAEVRSQTVPAVADLVLGQFDFTKNQSNLTDGAGLISPESEVADAAGHLYVADTGNNRVLGWSNAAALTNGEPADLVIGQPDSKSYLCNQGASASASSLCQPDGLAVDASGNLYVADSGNNRVLEYDNPFAPGGGTSGTPGSAGDTTADLVFGQGGDFTAANCDGVNGNTSADTLCSPDGVAVDAANNIYIADTGNSRVLEYSNPFASGGGTPGTPGSAGDTTADLVFGQGGDFTASSCDGSIGVVSADTLCGPNGVATDGAGDLYVADAGNSRVLEYNNPLATGGTPGNPGSAGDTTADLVFGQSGDFTASNCDGNDGTPGADTLCDPLSVALDGTGDLYVADDIDNRVLEYDHPLAPGGGTPGTPGSAGDTTADHVFGQGGDFTASNCDGSNGAPSADALCSPVSASPDATGNLYVTDNGNNRIVEYFNPLASGGGSPGAPGDTTADVVLGQFNFTNGQPNLTDAAGLISPLGAAIDDAGHLYLVDSGNNRVLGWRSVAALTNGQPADLVIGQADFISSLCNQGAPAPSANGLCEPTAVAVGGGGNVYVADSGNNRVLEYDKPFASGGGTPGTPGSQGDATADLVFGQGGDFTASNCDGSSGSASPDNLCYPSGVAVDSIGDIYVADTGNNRVLEYSSPLASGGGTPGTPGSPGDTTADLVFGQGGDFTASYCNGGTGTPSADTLCNPGGVASDGNGNLYVADAGNDRVLEYNNPLASGGGTPGTPGSPGDTTADLVFGQEGSFTSGGRGGGPLPLRTDFSKRRRSALPFGVAMLGLMAALATSGSSRKRMMLAAAMAAGLAVTQVSCGGGSDLLQPPNDSATPGAPISLPICNAGADGLCSPAAIAVDASGNVYVADQSNNRVLEYDNPLDPSGGTPGMPGSPGDTTADEVFGQEGDFSGTVCAGGQTPDSALNAAGLCGPSGVAVDSAGGLFISDSSNNRVLGFSGPATSASRAARARRESLRKEP